MSPAKGARLRLVVAAVLFSTGGAAVKATTFSGWQLAGFRALLAALTLLAVLPEARRGWTWRAALVGLAYGATGLLYVTANKLTTAANTIFLQATAPLYILPLAPLLLKERVRRRDLGFMALVAIGMALFFVTRQPASATAPHPAAGNLLAAWSGVTWGLTVIGLRWIGADPSRGSDLAACVIGNLAVFVVALPFALPLGSPTAGDWATLIYLGVFQVGVAYIFVITGLRQVGALEASLILLVEPALNPVWAWLVQGETPTFWAIVGAVLILGATATQMMLRPAEARPATEPA